MSFNLGNWADKLKCDVCEKDFEDLFPGEEGGDLPDDFWDIPYPEPPGTPYDDPPGGPFDDIEPPNPYPFGKPADGPDGGIIFGGGGEF